MRILQVPTTRGVQNEIVYNVNDYPYEKLLSLPTCKKAQKATYYNISSAFDIETTTIKPPWVDDKYLFTPYGFMYQWQFCIVDMVVMGRTWEEFRTFLSNLRKYMELSDNKKLVVYVHNLAFEFQFMKEFINIDNMFAKDIRKPMKFTSDGIEFRCSYFLSNMSLSKFCENSKLCYHYKLVDEYDYSKTRTPQTVLSDMELSYCYNDVRGLCECIDTMLEQDTISTMPLTNTGYVRRDYREVMKTRENRYIFVKTQLNEYEYTMLRRAFRGGNTHANRFKANLILNDVYSFDISSSYPTCIEIDDFPIGKFAKVKLNNNMKLDYYCKQYCVVMDISFFNITVLPDACIPYIDISHCYEKNKIMNDNGRVLHADFIRLTITNIDLDIIRSMYKFDGFTVNEAIYATKGKLPKELRLKLMDFYTAKTQLKGIEGKEYEYMKAKNRLNSTYGMMVTDMAHSEVGYDIDTMEWEEIKPNLKPALEQFYKSRNNFLSYQWGVFVTANARRRLQNMIDKVGRDIVYIDTDSIKFENAKHIKEFEDMNKILIEQAEKNDIFAYVDRTDFDKELNKDVTTRFYLGTWDNDGIYIDFKTLGSKKYCFDKWVFNKKTGEKKIKFEITVSGMSKDKGAKAVGGIENFNIGKTFTDIGRTTSWYNDSEIHQITINGDTFTTASNIGILETTYTLGVTNEYWALIGANKQGEIL
jgi:hypothetical protein